MERSLENFADYNCVKLENDALALWVTQDVGPRIIGLQLTNGDNLLAVLPNATATTPSGNIYHFRGGHRLWVAPEDSERTYVLDDTAVSITNLPRGIQTTQPADALTGIEKQMRITLPDNSAFVEIEHTVTNCNQKLVTLAPWAITQLKPGGFAILPQNRTDTGLLPNRRLVFWPYAQINSPHVELGDRFMFVHAAMKNEHFKMGWANIEGWQGYFVDNTLFVKTAAYQEGAHYVDFGSSSECYCNDDFLELETLGPQVTLAPGEKSTHREVWRLYTNVNLTAEESKVAKVISHLWD